MARRKRKSPRAPYLLDQLEPRRYLAIGFTVTPTSGLVTTEAGGTATFTIVMKSLPTANVTVGLSSSDTTEGTVAPTSITFTPANWNVAQTVTVTGVDDYVVDGNISYTIVTAPAVSADPNYNGRNPSNVSVKNMDNDVAGFTVTPTSGLVTTESGGTATFTVALTSQPTANVTTALSSSDLTEGTVSPASLTFTAANWNVPQTVTITGVDDYVIDGNIAYSIITAAATSADANYNGLNPSDVSVTNNDNDVAGFTVTPTSGLITTEFGGTDTFTVALTSQPTADVSIGLSSSDLTEGTVSPASLTFTAANWNTPQTVTITGVDDLVRDGNIAYTIITAPASSADPNYNVVNPSDVSVTNTDNDTAGFTVTPTSGLTTTEAGGTATFTVALTSQPTANVTTALSSSDLTEGTVSPASLTFTAANWNTPQTVTITGVDDFVADGNIAYTIVTAAATSADGNYNGLNPSDVSVTNNDNDVAGFTVTPTSGLTTTEAGGTATFTVALTSQPTADVTIPLSSSDLTEGTVSAASVTFTSANWNVPQTVTVTGVDDYVIDGNIAYSIITAAATSADGNYNGLNPSDVSVTNNDNDVAGFTVTPTSGLITTEFGGTDTFTVALTSQPTADVSIGLSSSDLTEGTVSPASLTFTAANWNTPQTVTITGVDDLVRDGNIAYTIVTAPASSADPNYNALNPPDISATNIDNDPPGLWLTPLSGLTTTEAGGTASFSAWLLSAPTADVVANFTCSDPTEGSLLTTSLTFTPANWNVPQTVTVAGVDDWIADGDIVYRVTSQTTSADATYDGLAGADVTLTNLDNDIAGIIVAPTSGLTTTEAGGTTTFTITLNSQPTADVTIPLSSSDLTEGTVSTASLTFTAANWNVPQTITITGVDDLIADGDIAYTIITAPASSADPTYNGMNPSDVSVTNLDNDIAGIIVAPTSGLTTTEAGGTATFTIALNSQPTADVTIPLSSSDLTEGTVSTSSLTFTAANWNVPQNVTITGVDDLIADGDIAYTIVTAPATSADPSYNGLNPADVSVTNLDNDTAGIAVNPTAGLTTTETGGTATFTIALNSQPTADVTIPLSSSDLTEGTVSPASLTFTAANWNVPQTITITGVDDLIADGDIAYSILTGAATSADPSYNGLNPADVSVTNLDNDTAGITVAPTSGLTTTEAGGTATFTIALNSQPTADVTIPLSSSDLTEGTVSAASLTFTAANWNTPQTVTITGVDDWVADGDIAYTILTGAATSADLGYDGLNPADVSVTNLDNDTAGITVAPTSGLTTTEAGGTAAFTVVLTSQPTADVSIGFSSSDLTEGTVSPASITFTSANWSAPQTITITGVDDFALDGNIAYTIVTAPANSADPSYNGLNPADVSVTNLDNDTAGITVTPTSGLTTTEAGGAATFTIVLNSQPLADVNIALSSSDLTEGTVWPPNLTFTAANWNVSQTVTITGVDDWVADGDIAYSIVTAPASSADPAYNGINPADVSLTNLDNDAAGITISPTSGLTTTEAGGTATFTIVLDSQPLADVGVALSSSDLTEGLVSVPGVLFTPANWSIPQTVTVTGVNDWVADGDIAYSIVTAPATSADPLYAGLNPPDVSLTNLDDDTAGISVAPASGLTTTESGGTATFTVVLNSQPTADVSIALASSDLTEGSVSAGDLTFTAANWNVPQVVTVTGVDDPIIDGNIPYSIVLSPASSLDPNYAGIDPADVSLTNTDNDFAGILVSPTSGLVTSEWGLTATFTISLASQPSADVTIPLSSSDITEGSLAIASLTFTPASWNIPQTVTVTGVDDAIADGDIAYTVVLSPATSADPNYNGLDPADVSLINTDNDTPGITVSPTAGLVTSESGGTATFTVTLNLQPTAGVVINLSSSNPAEGVIDKSSLTFTPLNWNIPQPVTITGVDDFVADGDVGYSIVVSPAASADGGYNGLTAANVSVTNLDNDTAGVSFSNTTGLTTTEAGGTASYTVHLISQPTADVTISLASTDTTEGTVWPPSLLFTAANWNVPRTITVTGVDDPVDDGDVTYRITSTPASADPLYAALVLPDVSLININNDTAGISVSPTHVTTTEAGGTASFSVRLTSQPTANVLIPLASSDLTEGAISLASVTFTPADWNVPQIVSVTGVDDPVDDGDIAYTIITAPALSPDPKYNGVDASDVSAVNLNDDIAGLSVVPASGLITSESGATATFNIALASQPTANVIVNLSTSDPTEGEPTVSSLTFTPANWNVPQTVTVRGVDDLVVDGNILYSILAAPTSADPKYNALPASSISVTNIDNDVPSHHPPIFLGIANIAGVENSPAPVINLRTAFVDPDDNPDTLTYTLLGNSNPGLFSDIRIENGLLKLTYARNASGAAQFVIQATDAAGTSAQGAFSVNVARLDDPPLVRGPAKQRMYGRSRLLFSPRQLNRVWIDDPDIGRNRMRVIVKLSSGQLSLVSSSGVHFRAGNARLSRRIVITGTRRAINDALKRLWFTPPPNAHGAATITICAGDLGHTGQGGPHWATRQIHIRLD